MLIRSMPSITPRPRNSILLIVMSVCAANANHARTAISDAIDPDAKLGVGSGNSDGCSARCEERFGMPGVRFGRIEYKPVRFAAHTACWQCKLLVAVRFRGACTGF